MLTLQEQFANSQGFSPSSEEYKAFLNLSPGEIGSLKDQMASMTGSAPAVISTDSGKKKLAEVVQGIQPTQGALTDPNNQSGTTSPTGRDVFGGAVMDPSTGRPYQTPEDQLMQNELNASKTPEQIKADEIKAQAEQNIKDMNAILDPLKAMLSSAKANQISAIQSQYARIIAQQEEANKRSERLQQTIGIRFGGRFTPEHTDALYQAKVNEGLQKVAELTSEENDAISKIQGAYDEKSYTLAVKEYDTLKDIRKQRDDAINNIEKDQLEKLKVLNEQKKLDADNVEAGTKIVSSIGYLALNLLTDDESNNAEQFKTLGAQYKVDPGKLLSEALRLQNEKVKYPAGDIGNYQFYVDQALQNGVSQDKIMDWPSYQKWDANLKAKASGAGAGLTPAQINSTVNQIAGAFRQEPIVKNYNEVTNKYLSMKSIIDSGIGGPADLSLVFDFMKGLDPNSVVRESEYATAAKSGNLFQGIFAKFNGYLKPDGGFLPDNVKNDFLELIRRKLDVSKKQYDSLAADYQKQIDSVTSGNFRGITNYTINPADSSTGVVVTPPGESPITFPDKASADAFKKEAELQTSMSIAWQ